ncbi:unnamed protein product [Schistosoma curassoni]|nr:unnamed protein product [Schistosoma curassoni]
MLIIYIIIPLILIRSSQSGSSSSQQSNCTEQQRSPFGRFVSAVGTFISLLCFLDGIWNTIAGFLKEAMANTG